MASLGISSCWLEIMNDALDVVGFAPIYLGADGSPHSQPRIADRGPREWTFDLEARC